MSNRAWVTLATNDSYGLGALVLAHSLHRVGSAYPAVILITPSVTDAMRERLRAVFADVITVDVLDSQDAAHLALLQRPELGITFTKIHCWNLTQYERCVFLDADILVVQNCDELFDREELSAAPDVGWPDCFNSGVFVFQPSADTFSRLIRFAQERGSFDGGDQGLLNSFFSDWSKDNNKRLSFLYNVTSAAFYSYLPALQHYGQNLKIIHFIGPAKPWLQHFNFESQSVDAPEHLKGFLQLWWDLFTSQVHTQLDESMANLEESSPGGHINSEADSGMPQDYFEQTLDKPSYQPTLDSTSEFPWHHPDKQIIEHEQSEQPITKNEFYDPWDSYSGNIPPSKGDSIETGKNVVSKHVWENVQSQYVPQEQHTTDAYNLNHNTPHQNWNDTQNTPHSNQYHHYKHNTGQEHDSHLGDIGKHSTFEELHKDYNMYSINEPYNKLDTFGHMADTQTFKSPAHLIQQNKDHHVYCVHMDYEKPLNKKHTNRTKSTYNGQINGDASDAEIYDDIRPRHPYDGFYLRHKMTVDSNGRKICIHQMPLMLLSPPSESYEQYEDASEPQENGYYSEEENDTGVAGNLARVQPGIPLQREAIDELSRRQGWESGNIDYMGADSFANIWAKISQTLNQGASSPPKQPSPPKESSQVLGEQAKEATEELAEKVAATSLSETPDIPVPAREAANAAGKMSDSPSQVTVPQLAFEASITEAEAKTDTSTAPNETVVAADISQSLDAISTEVPKEETTLELVETETVTETESTPISSHLHETKPLEPTSDIKDVHEVLVHENDVPKPDSISEKPVEVHAETISETPIKPSKVELTDATPVKSAESASEASVDAPKEESVPTLSDVHVPEPTKVISDKVQSEIHAPETVPTPSDVHEPEPTKELSDKVESAVPATETIPTPSVVHGSKSVSQVLPDAPIIEAVPATALETPAPTVTSPLDVQEVPVEDIQKSQVATPSDTPKPEFDSALSVPKQDKTPDKTDAPVSDSPPLANTPSREEIPSVTAAKLEARRKPAGKLQLSPPAAADPSPTPDSELEDAATLAQSIIASELRTPTVTSPSPTALAPPQLQAQPERLDVRTPDVPTPPVGAVSLSQIGVKPKAKPTTASQIESSVSEKPETDAPKKRLVKKVVKKDGASSGEAPVPPPRKKEKKPKDK